MTISEPPIAPADTLPPPEETVELWAWNYIRSQDLETKLNPGPPPEIWEENPIPRRLSEPGRPPEFRVMQKAARTRGVGSPQSRARQLHVFLHHELQAAELMCWALLAFPEAPREFREGLVRIALDEVRHMSLYRAHIETLGHRVGEFPVRDWFWERVPRCQLPEQFVAVMGLGFEAGNLEHARTFAARFRSAGDEEGARIQERVAREEIAHVRFGARWFREFTGDLDFESWMAALPEPLSPMLMRGKPLDREARAAAGLDDDFLAALESWTPGY